MNHDVLYVSADGKFRSSASYSARKDFKLCPRLFKLTRIEGWRSKRLSASTHYGDAIEEAVKWHIIHGNGGPEKFVELWTAIKKLPDFEKWSYSKVEVSWETLLLDGLEHLKLFAIQFPSLPLQNPEFQVPLRKHIFPGTSYGKLSNVAYLDILCQVPTDHPLLPKVENHGEKFRTLLIDCKTMGKELVSSLVSLDPQLIEYAWMKQKLDVGFLWFTKKGRGYKSGSKVILLSDVGELKAGNRAYILEKEGEWVYVGSWDTLKAYEAAFTVEGKVVKGNSKAGEAIAKQFLARPDVHFISGAEITKQSMQFVTALVSQEDVNDMGQLIGRTTVEMVVAHEEQFYPKDPSIRYPAEKCNTCYMRFICANDTAGRDANLTRTGEEWLDVELDDPEQ